MLDDWSPAVHDADHSVRGNSNSPGNATSGHAEVHHRLSYIRRVGRPACSDHEQPDEPGHHHDPEGRPCMATTRHGSSKERAGAPASSPQLEDLNMAKRSHPRRGSMAFSPRKRASRHFGLVNAWREDDAGDVRIQGFAGWKAGMTHILMRDMNPKSRSAGQEIRVPVTIVEVPRIRLLAVRGYRSGPYGKQTAGEAWVDGKRMQDAFPELERRLNHPDSHDTDAHLAKLEDMDLDEIRVIVATQPRLVTGSPSKTPEVMEIGLTGGDHAAKLAWAKERLGDELTINDVYTEGRFLDIVAVTKGYGWQGVIRRFGGKLLSHKNSKNADNTGTWVRSVMGCPEDHSSGWADRVPPTHGIQQAHPAHLNPDDHPSPRRRVPALRRGQERLRHPEGEHPRACQAPRPIPGCGPSWRRSEPSREGTDAD